MYPHNQTCNCDQVCGPSQQRYEDYIHFVVYDQTIREINKTNVVIRRTLTINDFVKCIFDAFGDLDHVSWDFSNQTP